MVPVAWRADQDKGKDMSRRTPLRIRVNELGALEVVDPGWDCLDLLRSCDPRFEPRRAPLEGFTKPRFLALRNTSSGHTLSEIAQFSSTHLWDLHSSIMAQIDEREVKPTTSRDATFMDLKIELARRILMRCTLCARRCGVDRISGDRGICRLGLRAQVAEHFVHIGEESSVNPSLLVSLAGCGLRCRYCQQGTILNPDRVDGEVLEPSLWAALDTSGARSLSFAGGNPDESVYAILRFLNAAPIDWTLPIVWNCHGAATPETLMLLNGVVDTWLPDYKYGNDACARRLSGIDGYPDAAREAIGTMLDQGVPVIVRILVLPGHSECCHIPVLRELAKLSPKGDLQVSIRGQYCPDWRIRPKDDAMSRRPRGEEIQTVWAQANALDLRLVT